MIKRRDQVVGVEPRFERRQFGRRLDVGSYDHIGRLVSGGFRGGGLVGGGLVRRRLVSGSLLRRGLVGSCLVSRRLVRGGLVGGCLVRSRLLLGYVLGERGSRGSGGLLIVDIVRVGVDADRDERYA